MRNNAIFPLLIECQQLFLGYPHVVRITYSSIFCPTVNARQVSLRESPLRDVYVRVKLFKRCLYCNKTVAGTELVYSKLLHTNTKKVDNVMSALFSSKSIVKYFKTLIHRQKKIYLKRIMYTMFYAGIDNRDVKKKCSL